MKVKMLRFGGIDGQNQHLNAGGVYDVPEELGKALLSRGWAEIPVTKIETAVARPVENTARRTGKAK